VILGTVELQVFSKIGWTVFTLSLRGFFFYPVELQRHVDREGCFLKTSVLSHLQVYMRD